MQVLKTSDFVYADTYKSFPVGYGTTHLIQEVVGKWRAGENPPLKSSFVSLVVSSVSFLS